MVTDRPIVTMGDYYKTICCELNVMLTSDIGWPWKKSLKVKKLWPPYLGQMNTYWLKYWWGRRKWANNTCRMSKYQTWNTWRQMLKYENVICQTPRGYWLAWEVTYVVRRITWNTLRQMLKYENVICQTPRGYWLAWEVTYVVRRKTWNTLRQLLKY